MHAKRHFIGGPHLRGLGGVVVMVAFFWLGCGGCRGGPPS